MSGFENRVNTDQRVNILGANNTLGGRFWTAVVYFCPLLKKPFDITHIFNIFSSTTFDRLARAVDIVYA